MVDSTRLDEVKKVVTIPKYFDALIIPEMGSYYDDYTVDFESRPVVKCPIHGENTPSLRWYDDTNTFYCFGCRASGDVINLHRLFTSTITGEQPTFEEAVEFLYSYFIKGKESAEIMAQGKEVKKKSAEKELSTNTEMLRLASYVAGLEQTLMIDNSISNKHRLAIYNAIDNVDLLCGINKLNATDGMKYIKEIVKTGGQDV